MRRTMIWAVGLFAASVGVNVQMALAAPKDGRPELVLQAPPAGSVDSVAASPDGSLVATASGESGVRLYDAKTGTLMKALGDVGDRSIAFSPDGRSIVAAGYHMDKLVGVYDVRTGQRLKGLAGHTEWETYAHAFSPDGTLLASTGADKQVLVWDVATGALRYRIASQPFAVTALAFSPDGATLAGGGGDKAIRLWDARTGQLRRSLEGHSDWVCAVAFSPDGRTIASGCCDWAYHRGRDTSNFAARDPGCAGQWKLWDAATGELKRTVTEPGRLRALAFAPDGRSLACAVGRDVRLHDLRADSPARVVSSHNFEVTSVAFTPDGMAILSGSHDHTAKRVAIASGATEWHAQGTCEQVNGVAVSADGSLLVTGSGDRRFAVRVQKADAKGIDPGAVRLWDARTGRLRRRLGDPAEQVMTVAFTPDGGQVVAGGARPDGKGVVRVWDAGTGKPIWAKEDHAAEVLAVVFAPDGSSLATASADGRIELRDPRTGGVMRSLPGHDGGATAVAFSPDGATLICGESRGGVRVWDVRTGRMLRTCKAADSRADSVTTDRLITSVAFMPDGGTFLSCTASIGNTYGEPVRFWDARTGEPKRAMETPVHHGRPIALSPDGTILAAGGKTIPLSDVRTGQLLHRLVGPLKKVQSIAFSADGRLLFAGASYGTTNVWEVATGRHLVTLFTFANGGTDDWLAHQTDGSFAGSPGAERYLAWRVGDELKTPGSVGAPLNRPDQIEAALRLQLPKTGTH